MLIKISYRYFKIKIYYHNVYITGWRIPITLVLVDINGNNMGEVASHFDSNDLQN